MGLAAIKLIAFGIFKQQLDDFSQNVNKAIPIFITVTLFLAYATALSYIMLSFSDEYLCIIAAVSNLVMLIQHWINEYLAHNRLKILVSNEIKEIIYPKTAGLSMNCLICKAGLLYLTFEREELQLPNTEMNLTRLICLIALSY